LDASKTISFFEHKFANLCGDTPVIDLEPFDFDPGDGSAFDECLGVAQQNCEHICINVSNDVPSGVVGVVVEDGIAAQDGCDEGGDGVQQYCEHVFANVSNDVPSGVIGVVVEDGVAAQDGCDEGGDDVQQYCEHIFANVSIDVPSGAVVCDKGVDDLQQYCEHIFANAS